MVRYDGDVGGVRGCYVVEMEQGEKDILVGVCGVGFRGCVDWKGGGVGEGGC